MSFLFLLLRRSLALLALVAPQAGAQTIEVFYPPTSGPRYPRTELAQAVASAPAGATIVVHGGIWTPITITRPLTILGAPTAILDGGSTVVGPFPTTITLAGPGSGRVVLQNLNTIGVVFGFQFSASAPAIGGGGFDELHVFDCSIRAPEWCCLTGVGVGRPAIDTSVPYLLIERSSVRGARTDSDGTYLSGGIDGGAGIRAPASLVTVLDSEVRGGDSGAFTSVNLDCSFGCPGGYGGVAVQCDTLLQAGSSFTAGTSATWETAFGIFCCQVPPGPALDVAADVALGDALRRTSALRLGAELTLELDSTGGTAQLFLAFGARAPVDVPGFGLRFFDPASAVVLGAFTTPGSVTLRIPPDPALLARELCLQALDPLDGWSRPVAGALTYGKSRAR